MRAAIERVHYGTYVAAAFAGAVSFGLHWTESSPWLVWTAGLAPFIFCWFILHRTLRRFGL